METNPCIIPTPGAARYDPAERDRWMHIVSDCSRLAGRHSLYFMRYFLFTSALSHLFLLQHNRFLYETKEREPDVVILGDNITSQLETRCVWTDVFVPMHALNFSVIGDLTQQVLWRIQNGELDNIKPKVGKSIFLQQ